MATAGLSPLECPICAELYNDGVHQPKLLTCHHTLCLSCIVQLAQGNTVHCPNKCKLVTTLPNLSPEERRNVTTEKDHITKRAKKLQYSFYIDTIKEIERFQQLALTQNTVKLCSKHNETLTVWCKTCQRVVCVKCLFTSHKGHQHDLLETVTETFQDKINKNIKQIKAQTQKLRSENARKTKQQYITDIDRQFEQISNDVGSMLENKKQAIKNQVTLAVDEYVNIHLASLDSLGSVYQQAANSDDMLTKIHVSSSNALDSRLNQLIKQKLTIDNQTMAQIKQHSKEIKQELHKTLESVETPTLSYQLVSTDLKASSTSSATILPTLSHRESYNNTRTSSSRTPATPASHHPITNRPVAKIGKRGSGPGQFSNPMYIAVDRIGMMYVSEQGNHRIQKLNSCGDHITFWKTDGFMPGRLAVNYQLNELICAKVDDDDGNFTNEVIIYSLEGHINKEFTITGEPGITGVAVNSRGHIVCNHTGSVISVVTRNGDILHRFSNEGSGPGQFNCPLGVCTGPDDDIIVVDSNNHRIQILDHQGQFKHQFGTAGNRNGQFKCPGLIAVDQYHQILVTDFLRSDVQMFSYNGEFIRCIDSKDDKMFFPYGLAVTQDHHVLVTEFNCDYIFKFKYM